MGKKSLFNKVNNTPVEDKNILEEKINAGEIKVSELTNKIKKKSDFIKTITIWSLPFRYKSYVNESVFSKNISFDWSAYKELLYDNWRDLTINRGVISPSISVYGYWLGLIGTVVITFIGLSNNWNSVIGLNFFSFFGFTWLIYEIISGILGIAYYLIRPNLINKSQAKLELKKLNKEFKYINNELTMNKNLLEQYKISQINPMQKFTEVKTRNIDELQEIIDKAREEVIPNISTGYANAFSNALDKAEKLLEMGREDGRVITEINKIYVIYITDISNILLKSEVNTLGDRTGVIEMLNNFSNFLDRKIEKFDKINKILVDSDISALNKAFIEEE